MDAPSPGVWDDEGVLRSRATGDVYFSKADGLGESRAVFLAGCGLPGAWTGRRRFTVGEIGFGTGLNIAALLQLWARERPAGGRLHVFSIEGFPLPREDAVRALARWPDLEPFARPLLEQWPGRAPGVHRIEAPQFAAVVDVCVGEAADALRAWTGKADAWFLDGFSPSLNPEAWREDVLSLVAGRSHPGARAGTFTVAGRVRRGLQAAGFLVERRPGFGAKRERLEAVLPGERSETAEPAPIAVIGGGIAGVSLARALRALGADPWLFDDGGPAASANPAALVTPRLDAGLGPAAQLSARAFERAVGLYERLPEAVIARGVVQLEAAPRDARRFATIAASGLFEPGAVTTVGPAELAADLGPTAGGLRLGQALSIEPRAVLEAWGLAAARQIARLEPDGEGWRLLDETGALVARALAVCLAAGAGSRALDPDLPLQPVRGQMSFAAGEHLDFGVGWGGYAAPARAGVCFGATYDRDETDTAPRAESDARNLANLARGLPALAARLKGRRLTGRASIRAATPDRLPLAGAHPGMPGLFLLTGLGSRGFSFAPLLAEHVAALVCGAPSPLSASLAQVVDPARFLAERSGNVDVSGAEG